MVEQLEIHSSIGRRVLLASELMVTPSEIEHNLNRLTLLTEKLNDEVTKEAAHEVGLYLRQLRDIRGSIKNLERGNTLDDIEIFEIKHFAIISEAIRQLVEKHQLLPQPLPSLEDIILLLDPDRTQVPSFYIYDSYSKELALLRKQIRTTADDKKLQELYDACSVLEDNVRVTICNRLRDYTTSLSQCLEQLGLLDVMLAKCYLTQRFNLSCPTISKDTTTYKGLFHPQVMEVLKEGGKSYQPVDIELPQSITLVSGANMAGKTVLLKALALSQYLFQLGFFVPAQSASIAPAHQIITSIGDHQSELEGLSAYASEILTVNQIVTTARKDNKILVLIDELARTTNPTEGKAIVTATANLLNDLSVRGVITTHYSGITGSCRRLRVKGLLEHLAGKVDKTNISSYIDYSLIHDDTGVAPHEALRIAELLNVDPELIQRASDALTYS